MRSGGEGSISELFDKSEEFEQAIASQGEAEALRHLSRGRPVYYAIDQFPGLLVQRASDGSEALVRVDSEGRIVFVRLL